VELGQTERLAEVGNWVKRNFRNSALPTTFSFALRLRAAASRLRLQPSTR
jgi:hypothetical protein